MRICDIDGKIKIVNIRHGANVHSDISIVDPSRLSWRDQSPEAPINGVVQPKFAIVEGELRMELDIEPDEDFFGLGLQLHSHNQRGTRKILRTNADPIYDNGFSHVVAPFAVSTRGYGILINTAEPGEFDIGCTSPGRLFYKSAGEAIDLYIIKSDCLLGAIQGYHILTGMQKLPPGWGLGLLYRAYLRWPQDKIVEFAMGFRERRVPCDVIGLEPGWQTKSYPCSYVWNRDLFPDPKAMIDNLHNEGFRINLWEHAWVHNDAPFASRIREYSGDKPSMNGLAPDFTLPEAKEIFGGYHGAALIGMGVDGFKLDECDGSDNTGGWFFPDESRFPSGIDGDVMHNAYGYLYQELMHEAYRKEDRRTYLLCRGNWASSNGNPTVAYSDLYDFSVFVRGIVNSGFCGNLWSPEVRSTADPKDFIRRSQAMFFSHMPQVNAWSNGVTPWDLGDEVCSIFRKYSELRIALIPYLYSAFRKSLDCGTPVIRALVIDHPDDIEAREIDDEYMYGDAFLVAPVVNVEAESRDIYLPAGIWYDYWSSAKYAGSVTFAYDAPLERLPLFVKGGSVILSGAAAQNVSNECFKELVLTCYPGGCSRGLIYIDDLESLGYERGEYHRQAFTFQSDGARFTLKFDIPDGSWTGDLPESYLIEIKDIDDCDIPGFKRVASAAAPHGYPCFSYENRTLTIRPQPGDLRNGLEMSGTPKAWNDKEWRRIYRAIASSPRVDGALEILDTLINDEFEFSLDLFLERLGCEITGIVDGVNDEEAQRIIPFNTHTYTKKDRVQPKNCVIITEVANGRVSLPVEVNVETAVSPGWRVARKDGTVTLQPGTKRHIIVELAAEDGQQPAGLDAEVTVSASLERAKRCIKSVTKVVWGGYITSWTANRKTESGSPGSVVEGTMSSALNVLPDGYDTCSCRVWSPIACKARLELGMDTPCEVLFNEQSVGRIDEAPGTPHPAQHVFGIDIPSGWSTIALDFRIDQSSRRPRFFARVAGEWGDTLERLEYQP